MSGPEPCVSELTFVALSFNKDIFSSAAVMPHELYAASTSHYGASSCDTNHSSDNSRLLCVTLFRSSPLSLLLRWVSCQLCELILYAIMCLLYAVRYYIYLVSYFINGIPIGFSIIIHGSCCVYVPCYIDAHEPFDTRQSLCSLPPILEPKLVTLLSIIIIIQSNLNN